MYINPALMWDLEKLTAPLEVGLFSELAGSVQALEDAATLTIRSLLGWRLSFQQSGQELVLSSLQPWVEARDIRASLSIPVTANAVTGTIKLYAGRTGAFLLFVHDIASAMGLADDVVRLDDDLSPNVVFGISGLDELSTINQAIGVLVERGDTIPDAHRRLEQDATAGGVSVHTAAGQLMSQHLHKRAHPGTPGGDA